LRAFLALLVVIFVMFSGSGYALAQEKQAFSLTFYQQNFTVTPEPVEGTDITFEQIKPYIPIVFPDYKKDKQPRIEIIGFVHALINGYQQLYDNAIQMLAERLVKEGKWDGEDMNVLKAELKALFRAGQMKDGIARFAPEDRSLKMHFAQVQEMYLRHLTCVYIYNMLIASPEGRAAMEALEADYQQKLEKKKQEAEAFRQLMEEDDEE